ncbi:hypothetical protein CCS92_33780 [Methylobacterium radiotolerans]|nr:hypothetical protein CCS92_33780 [Methylobacterium radiotolerans]
MHRLTALKPATASNEPGSVQPFLMCSAHESSNARCGNAAPAQFDRERTPPYEVATRTVTATDAHTTAYAP